MAYLCLYLWPDLWLAIPTLLHYAIPQQDDEDARISCQDMKGIYVGGQVREWSLFTAGGAVEFRKSLVLKETHMATGTHLACNNNVMCQAHPVLVKKANQMCGSFLFKFLSRSQ